jgi:hypothetical protein
MRSQKICNAILGDAEPHDRFQVVDLAAVVNRKIERWN